MRQITEQARQAFFDGVSFSKSNTTVVVDENGYTTLYLHGNAIACRKPDGETVFALAGWPTPTTRERLKGVDVEIIQRNGDQYHVSPATGERTLIDPDFVYLLKPSGCIAEGRPNRWGK